MLRRMFIILLMLLFPVWCFAGGNNNENNSCGNQDQSQQQQQQNNSQKQYNNNNQNNVQKVKIGDTTQKVKIGDTVLNANPNITINTATPTVEVPVTVEVVSAPVDPNAGGAIPSTESAVTDSPSGKTFRQFLYVDSDGFPALPEYNGPWTGPSWNILPLEYLPKFVTMSIAKGWDKGDYKCEFYPYRPQPKYTQQEFYIKTVGKDGVLPLSAKYEIVGFAFCRATFDGTTLSMIGAASKIGMNSGATTAIVLGASEEFDPRNWSIGLTMAVGGATLGANEGDRGATARVGAGVSYGGSSTNKGQGLVFLLADEWPDDPTKHEVNK